MTYPGLNCTFDKKRSSQPLKNHSSTDSNGFNKIDLCKRQTNQSHSQFSDSAKIKSGEIQMVACNSQSFNTSIIDVSVPNVLGLNEASRNSLNNCSFLKGRKVTKIHRSKPENNPKDAMQAKNSQLTKTVPVFTNVILNKQSNHKSLNLKNHPYGSTLDPKPHQEII